MTSKILLFLGLTLSLAAADASPGDFITALPDLSGSAAWKSSDDTHLQVSGSGAALAVKFDTSADSADLMLQQPVDVPDNADNLVYLLDIDPKATQFDIRVIMEDGKGQKWYALAKAPGTDAYHKNLGVINADTLKGLVTRLSVPAFAQPGDKALSENFAGTPSRPWKLLGLRLLKDAKATARGPVEFYLQKFAITSNLQQHSDYFGVWGLVEGREINYGGTRAEFCTEIEGDPGVATASFYRGKGLYQVQWRLYNDYAGVPLATGSQEVTIGVGKDALPLALQLGQVVRLPRQKPGTYWARWRAHYFPSGTADGAPAQIVSGEERIYVSRSAASVAADAPAAPATGWLRILPHGSSFITDTPADFVLGLAAQAPAGETSGVAQITVRTNHLHTVVKKVELPLDFSKGGAANATIDLSSLAPGPYKIEAALQAGGKVYDREEILAGIRNEAGALPPLTKLPEGVLDAKQAVTRKEPYFHLSPLWHSKTWDRTDYNRWDWYKNLLEIAPAVSKDIEYETAWSILEPLPGVYDWEEMDLFLAKAHELNEQVLVWPGFWGEEPAWLPAMPSQTKDGRLFFDFVYDFFGIRQDYANAIPLQDALVSALHSVVGHVRDNPAVQGYFIIQELPGDATFANWIGGFSPEEVNAYRSWLKQNFGAPGALSTRWGRTVDSIDDVQPPDVNASQREWLDWLVCRADACDTFMGRLLHMVRDTDPLRPIWVYGDVFGTKFKLSGLPEMGCAKANGGSHDGMHPFSISQIGYNGIMQRTEDHLPGKWTGYFPEVLDASLFSMSYGGGLAMNCKAYFYCYFPELGKDHFPVITDYFRAPYSLDKWHKFQPIWAAMRPTNRMPIEVLEMLDTEAGLLNNKQLTRDGFWDGNAMLACYRAHINFAADEFPNAAKTRLLLMTKDGLQALTRERIEQVKAYVNGGGTLFMLASEGRKCVDEPASDWVLLHELGFPAPTAATIKKGKGPTIGAPVSGQTFDPTLAPFGVSGLWPHTPGDGETTVAAQDGTKIPALTWKAFGKGKVAVLWTDALPPRGDDQPDGNVLKAAANWTGIEDVMGASNPAFWLNMMKHPTNGQYFGLVHAGQWQGKPSTTTEGNAWFKVDPAATYHVTELITGKDLGNMPGATIGKDGIATTLTPRQTAVYQFDPVK